MIYLPTILLLPYMNKHFNFQLFLYEIFSWALTLCNIWIKKKFHEMQKKEITLVKSLHVSADVGHRQKAISTEITSKYDIQRLGKIMETLQILWRLLCLYSFVPSFAFNTASALLGMDTYEFRTVFSGILCHSPWRISSGFRDVGSCSPS